MIQNYVIWQKGKAKLHKGSIANVFFSYVGLERTQMFVRKAKTT